MTRIIVTPEDLQDLSMRFAHAGDDVQEIGDRLRRILRNLDWEARQRSGLDGFVNQACHRATAVAVEAQDLSRYLSLTAENFLQADNQGVQLIATLPKTVISPERSMSIVGGVVIAGIGVAVAVIMIPVIGLISNVSRKWTATDLMKAQVETAADALKDVKGLTQAEWEKLDSEARIKTLQKVEDALAAAQGRSPVKIQKANLDPGTNGVYRGSETPPFIDIDEDLLAKNDLHATLTTLAHESRHAYQHHAIENANVHPDAEQVESWRTNFDDGNYIEPEKNPKGYWNQPVERDARHYGDYFADQIARQGVGKELVEEFGEKASGW
ncbi:MAG: hypothetical protein JW892_03095 [Anaerolineae bacterium]|nr:hypothetical protein [Anaerolineae bacterium]